LDLALSNIIENACSTNSARVVMPTVIDELVIPAVVGGDPSWSSLILDSRSRLCGKAGIRLLTFHLLLFADLGGS